MSTLVIIAHVKDGTNLARQHHLPHSIIDFIEQHHGTTLVEYFFRRANEKLDEDVTSSGLHESSYRYPGPKPQSMGAIREALALDAHMHIHSPKFIAPKMRMAYARSAAFGRWPERNPEDLFPRVTVGISDFDGTYTIAEMDRHGVDVMVPMIVDHHLNAGEEAEMPFPAVVEHLFTVALAAAIAVFMLPVRAWQQAAPWLFLACIALLVLVLIPGIGKVLKFKDPKGTTIELFSEWNYLGHHHQVIGVGPLKLGHVAFIVDDAKK